MNILCAERTTVLRWADIVFSFAISLPCMVFYWRGTWDLLDSYVFPDDMVSGSWLCCVLGLTLRIVISTQADRLTSTFLPQNSIPRKAFFRLFNLLYSWIVIAHWRGLWNLVDHYTGYGIYSNAVGLLVSLAVAWGTRCCKTGVAPPIHLNYDNIPDFFDFTPKFKTKVPDFWRYLADQLFTHIFCYTSLIVVWRCLWNLMDDYILPDNWDASSIATLVGGCLICFVLILLDRPMQFVLGKFEKRSFFLKLVFEDAFDFLGLVAVVGTWRGLWNLVEEYVFPDPVVGGWVCHWIGYIPLTTLQCFCAGYDTCVMPDGEHRSPDGHIWEIDYLQSVFNPRAEPEEKKVPDATKEKLQLIGQRLSSSHTYSPIGSNKPFYNRPYQWSPNESPPQQSHLKPINPNTSLIITETSIMKNEHLIDSSS